MLISHLTLDSTFSNPVDSLLPYTSTADTNSCFPTGEQGWLGPLPDGHRNTEYHRPKEATFRALESRPDQPEEVFRISEDPLEKLLLQQLKDCFRDKKSANSKKEAEAIKPHLVTKAMVEPEDDLKCLMDNERQLEMCGYYYGSLSWLDASHLLRQCKVGTFLVRDSEHCSYLYTLSVQTKKGPTSCRIEYSDGSFRLDSAKDLSHKMPRFECVTHLIDFYVHLPKWKCGKAVWLDMDEENSLDVPVQIYQPLYRQVRSLQHMCRVNIVRQARMDLHPCKPRTIQNPASALERTLEKDSQCKNLPNIIKEYLSRYPYSQ